MQEWVGLHHGELRTRRVRVPRTVLIADLCCVSGHRCPGLGSMAWIPSVGLERGEVMLTTEYHRYDENPRESTRWLRYLYGHISHTVLGCIRYPGDSRGVRYGSKGICRQQIRQKKRRMMKDAHLLRARQSTIWNGKIQKTWDATWTATVSRGLGAYF